MKMRKKEMNKKQAMSLILMFFVIAFIYSFSIISHEGAGSFINEFKIGKNNFLSDIIFNPSITGRVTGFANEDPYFDPSPPDYNLTQDQLFEMQLNATDPENDTITFTDNSDAPEINWIVFEMNGTGFISFTPENDDVGNHTVGISIEDGINDPVTENVIFSVINVNDPPEIVNYTPSNLTPSTTENNSIGFSFEYNATDPDLDYGDILNVSWIIDGVINSTAYDETSGSWTLTTGFCEPRYKNITLVVVDSEGESDSVTWNLSITNVNRVPIWNGTINHITWNEDTDLLNNISLDEYFNDDDYTECNDNPSFSSTGNSNITINIGAAGPHWVSFYPAADWFGTEEVFFTVDDGYATADSNNFTLNVTNVQDPPTIQSITDQQAYCYVEFNYQVNASDEDGDTLTYYDNTTLFDINSSTGLITFSPIPMNIDNYSIKITVGDGNYNASTNMNLTIANNTAPVIDAIDNKSVEENSLFILLATGSDVDGDSISYSSNYSRILNPVSSNSTAANFSFTPNDDDNGNHTIEITATDSKGATATTTFILEVVDVNNPPVLSYIGPRIAKINHTFSLKVNATDPDSGDTLMFADNTSLFNIHWQTGMIEFTPDDSKEGNYSVNASVTDDASVPKTDYEIVLFEVTPNRAPSIDEIGTQTAIEDSQFNLTINASDPDGDSLNFTDNSSMFTISLSSGFIIFTPEYGDVGLHEIQINATDEDGAYDSKTFWINITEINDPPYFNPALENQTATEGILFYYDINASDEEGDNLIFNNNNTELFTIDPNTGVISFTPENEDVGNYSIEINVTDNNSVTSSVMEITILNVNTAPNITSYIPQNLTQNTAENLSLLFSVNVSDDDIIHGDIINYTWKLDSVNQSSNQSWIYEPGFASAGTRNITIIVSDSQRETDSIEWNITVNNTNRIPTFGIIIHTTEADFSSGTKSNVNTTLQEGDILLDKQDLLNYYSSGTFTSPVINLLADSNMNISYINWTETRPAGTNITMQTRSSVTAAGIDNKTWSSVYVNDSLVDTPHYQYAQYRTNLSTSDTLITPELHEVKISYIISNFTGNENTIYVNWIDLDDFFNDSDSDDSIRYNAFENYYIDVSIDNTTHQVTLAPAADWYGSETVYFTINDSYNTTRSNNVKITFVEYEGITPGNTIIYTGGGGGGATRTIIKTKTEEVDKPYSFNIITPQTMTMYQNDTAIAPINLNNYGENILTDVDLSASVNNSDIKLKFTKDHFDVIDKNSFVNTNLIIESYNAVGSYEVVVYANVKDPKFNDSAKFMMSSIELGQWGPEEFDTKISFTRDLLEENPECLELNEQLSEARDAISRGDYNRGQLMIQSVVDTCRYLITTNEPIIEEPSEDITENQRIRIVAAIAGVVFIIILITYLITKSGSGKRKRR
jgi:hypothetical protein